MIGEKEALPQAVQPPLDIPLYRDSPEFRGLSHIPIWGITPCFLFGMKGNVCAFICTVE